MTNLVTRIAALLAGLLFLALVGLMWRMSVHMGRMTEHVGAMAADVAMMREDVAGLRGSVDRMAAVIAAGGEKLEQLNPAQMGRKMAPGDINPVGIMQRMMPSQEPQ